jgi:hypothetical protein
MRNWVLGLAREYGIDNGIVAIGDRYDAKIFNTAG